MRRILHVIPGLSGGGAERQLSILAARQAERGYDVHIALLRNDAPAEISGSRVTLHRISASGNYDPAMALKLRGIVRRAQPEILQTWLTLPDVMGGVVARLAGTPWILSERSEKAAYPPSWKHRIRASLARRCRAIIANSAGGREYWIEQGVDERRIHVIPNAVVIPPASDVPAPIPNKFANKPLILFAGRLSAEKNPLVLVDALSLALQRTNAVALLCGVGPLEGEVRARIDAAGMGDRIALAGHRDDVAQLMRQASLCVAVSVFEGNPNVVLEAMSVGCPLVVSDIPAYTRLLDVRSAQIVPADNSELIGSAIVSVLGDPHGARERAKAAQSLVKNRTPDDLADAHENVYARIV